MSWRPVLLRGTRVFARCDAAGKLADQDGKVEIRYRQGDGKAYRALARNLSVLESEKVLPDDYCVEAGTAPVDNNAAVSPKLAPRKKALPAVVSAPVQGEQVIAYTDGACSGNPGPAGLGVVLLHGGQRRELSEYLGVGTNNVAELTAILRALEAHEGELPLWVHTDSQYAIGVLSKGWKAKANQELIQRIKDSMKPLKQLRFVYVPGHAGVPLNERADELARAAVSARKSSGWQTVRDLHAERA